MSGSASYTPQGWARKRPDPTHSPGFRAAFGHLETEDRVGRVFDLIQLAVQGGVQHGAGIADADPFPDAIWSADPAGVEQPAVHPIAQDFAFEQVGIKSRVVDHERTAKAGAEGDLRFFAQANLGAGDLGGIAGDEVVERLVGGQAGDGRHHPGRIAGQEDDILGMPGALFG